MTGVRVPAQGSRRRRGILLQVLLFVVLAPAAFVVAAATPAWAHAEVVEASPAPGSGLPQAPGAVVIRFDEPLNHRLSDIEIVDASGRDVGEGPARPVEDDPNAMRRKLGLLSPGVYTVRWTTVSTVDGHTLHGSYSFGIGTSATADESVRASPVDSEGWLGLVGRFVALVGLTLWTGWAVLAGVAERAKVPTLRMKRVTRISPWLVFAGTAVAVMSSSLVASGSVGGVTDVVVGGSSGRWRTLLLTASLAAGLAGHGRLRLQRALVAVAVVSEAASGHAASSPAPVVATVSFTVHLAAVGTWAFAIVASLLSTERLRTALSTFTPFAVGAAGVVALTGIANASLELSAPGDLVTTGYGRTLLLKTVAFVAIAALGLAHYVLRRMPEQRATALKLPLRGEAAAVVVAVALATVLVGYPDPPREIEAAAHPDDGESLTAMVGREAVSVAQASGPFVVGLSLSPPRPGPIDIRVDVLGIDDRDELTAARLRARNGSGSAMEVPLGSCGMGCFRGEGVIDAAGKWRVVVSIASARGPIELDASIPMPVPAGDDELEDAIAAMEKLRSARMRQDLSAEVGGPTIVSRYLFEAPDKMDIKVEDSHRIVIGETEYRRTGDDPWTERDWPGSPFRWPEDYYRSFWTDPAAVRELGTEDLDGERHHIVSLVRPDLPAWFRLWVRASDSIVVRQEMRAEGHIMDEAYADFNEPVGIRPPE